MKTLHTVGLLVLALAAPFATRIVIAADPPPRVSGFAPLAPGEAERLLDDAKTRHARAQALRREAEDEFRRAEAACYDKIMVSGCIGDAKKARLRKTLEARQLDLGADRLQREVKLRENAQRDAQGAENAPEREADAAARNSEEAQARAAEQAKREAERERELQAAPARAAVEAENRQRAADEAAQRQSAEAGRASKRAESAARQRAEIDRKAAEHAKRRAEAQAAADAKAAAANPAGATSAPR